MHKIQVGAFSHVVYDPDDPAGFNIRSKNPDTKQMQKQYWTERSRGYNLSTLLELHNTEMYEHLIESLVPKGRIARICDVGTACGTMAIVAARLGHEVTGIDISEDMVYHAQKNATAKNLHITFLVADAEDPHFEDESFDLIIFKSTIWCLSSPIRTLRKWYELLRPGGHILIMDGNHYLSNYDPDYAAKRRLDIIKDTEEQSIHGKTNMDHVDFSIIREIAKDLPVSSVRRPGWDLHVLMGLGFDNIYINCNDKTPYRIFAGAGNMAIPINFVITARRPPKGSDPLNYKNTQEDDSEASITADNDHRCSVFKALSDANRIRIIQLLLCNRMNVKSISEATGLSQALVSHNLKVLQNAGLVVSSRNGKEVFFIIKDVTSVHELLYYALK